MAAFLSKKHNVNPPVIVDTGAPIKKSGTEFSTAKESKPSKGKSADDSVKKEQDVSSLFHSVITHVKSVIQYFSQFRHWRVCEQT